MVGLGLRVRLGLGADEQDHRFPYELSSTKMPEEFWVLALGRWRAHERVPAPGLTFIRDDLAQGEDNLDVAVQL